ncbi:MAG: YciI family protein [Gammaproteobacteria bacterium]|nr:YciI family protein [Gammaproteobacteria bacterium]MDE0368194.1 YciI family protein [Gammaproteobacteria bacterium]
MYFVVSVVHKPEAESARSELQETFRSYLRNHPDHAEVVVHHGGPTLDDGAGNVTGLLLILEAPSAADAQAFLADSPYGKAEIFAESRIQPWDWFTGRPG